ncbi:MAG: GEVED domain-containing protein, partial [Thermoanaerobaculia bacterium]|nr:GEVED domain-containing protein [Thermoanaerobaculia bacterium]
MRTSPWSNLCLTALRAATPWAILAALSAPALWAQTVPLNNFSVPPGATVTITVDVDVKDPLAICASAVSNQGSFSGTNLTPAVQTDDPDIAGAANPTLTALDVVDLAIAKTDGAATEVPGTAVTYTITVSNAGPSPALGATVSDTFPAILSGVTWTCVGSGGATCTAAGSGNLSDLVNVPVGGAATYTVTGTISAAASGTLVNTATVTKAASQIECNLANNSATDTDTLTPQVDLAISKTDGLTTINAGSPTTYTITVTNSGPSDAIGATVADTFPAALLTPSWTCVASALSSCTAGPTAGNINDTVTVRAGGTLIYTVNATVSGAFSGTLSNTATVAAAGGTTDTNAGNNSATDTTTVNAVADVAITKDDGVTTAVPGQSVVYTLVASNAGPSAAPAAQVTDTFPAACASVSWTCVGAGGGSCPANGSGNLNATVNLPMGGTATFSVTCNIASSATGSLANTVTIGAGAGVTDPNAANNSASDTDTLTPQANLAISKSNGVSSVDAGASTTYTITASNAGPSDAPGATVADTFPANLTGVTWTCVGAGGGTCPANGSGNLAALVNLPAGGSVTFSATGTVSAAATGTLVNTATVTEPGGVTETAPANNTSTDTDTITISTDLNISKTDGVATEVPGTGVVYTIVVGNAGPSNAQGATVADTFPATLTGVTWTCVGAGGGSCAAAGSGNLNTTVDLPVGATATFTVSATIDAAATGTLANTATVTVAGGTTDPNVSNNSATDTDTLTPQVDLAITKTDGLTTANAGAATTYTIVVTNSGPSDAVNATVADTFPVALQSPTWTCVASPLSSCAAAGSGNLNDSVTVRSGGTLTYTVNGTISGTFSGILSNTATVAAPGGTTDTNGANNSATDTTDVLPVADLSISKSDGVTTAVPGLTVTYTIVAANAGPATATGASVADTFPAACATVSWTCVGAGGGTCTAGPVAGNIADSANLPASATATYTAVCTLANNASGSLVNTVTISGGGVTDTVPGNNSATDTDTILTLDFGDAPDGSLAAPSGYPTLLADNGARHGVTALKMGANLDSEADGQPTVNADGDDANPALGPDDEDGVTLPAFLVACESANVTVNASGVAKLDAWVDYNANGSFADPGEKIFNNQALVAGANVLPVTVPCGVTPATKSFARFRLSTVGGLAATGVAADGEVEDYAVALSGLDFGDAPDPTFPTLFASNGARHGVNAGSPGPFLGAIRDTEANGQPNVGATGDDLAGTDDEDGVLFTTPLIPGQSASVTVTASATGSLRAWVDWDGDGSWATVGDELVFSPGATLAAGANVLTFTVPATANSSLTTYARFRFASTAVAGFSGLENDGEVEDHQVQT